MKKPSIVYRYGGGLYVNLTNRCPNSCVFCVRNEWKMDYHGNNLDLGGAEPSPEEVVAAASAEWARKPFGELVFCGYGEPTMRIDALLAVARAVKGGAAAPIPRGIRIRVNTNGLANAVWGRDVAAEMKGLVDSAHVSLNTPDPAQWAALMRPDERWAKDGFEKVKDFIRSAAASLPEVYVTAVEGNGVDAEAFKALAASLGARPRLRPRLSAEDDD